MKDIAIYGAGGFGREIACLINMINKKNPQWNLVGFFDDGKEKGSKNEYGEILGGIDELNQYPDELAVAIAIGTPNVVEKVYKKIKSNKIYFPNLISPDVVFLDENNFSIGKGNIICSGCFVSCNVSFGDFNILNVKVSVGHDTAINSFNAFMPSVKISGEIKINNNNFFGVGSTVLQQIKIGDDTVIGANSLILRKTKDGNTYVGSPATIVKY